MNFCVYQVQKGHYVYHYPIVFIYIVRRHTYVSDLCNKQFSLLMVYSHSETNENPAKKKKIKSNLSAKRSTLKPCNSKTRPMTPDFLYHFLTLLQSKLR
jgi:hypothetical protein